MRCAHGAFIPALMENTEEPFVDFSSWCGRIHRKPQLLAAGMN